MEDLERRIFDSPSVPGVFRSGFEVYLVGGFLRDILRGANSTDIDFIVKGQAGNLRSWLSSKTGGKAFEFKKGPLLRVVTDNATLDFAELKGNLEDDLLARDFTMNALAWSPEKGIIDPLNGSRDIRKGTIRAISEKNLISDPLRLLRAYRFAAELGWRIDPTTRRLIRKLRPLMKVPAAERITLELFKILDSENPVKALSIACSDGILTSIIYRSYKQLRANIKVLCYFERFLKKLHDRYNLKLEEVISQGLTYRGLLRAEILLFGANLGQSRLKISRRTLKRVSAAGSAMSLFLRNPATNKSHLFDIFGKAGDSAMDFAILARRKRVLDEGITFSNLRPFLSTEEIMMRSGVTNGPEVGRLVRELTKLQFTGKIKGVAEALFWLGANQHRFQGH